MTKREIAAAFSSLGVLDVQPGHPMLEGWLAVPLTGRTGRTLGLIQVADKVQGEFTEGDGVVLVQLAQLAAVAIENAERSEAGTPHRRDAAAQPPARCSALGARARARPRLPARQRGNPGGRRLV